MIWPARCGIFGVRGIVWPLCAVGGIFWPLSVAGYSGPSELVWSP